MTTECSLEGVLVLFACSRAEDQHVVLSITLAFSELLLLLWIMCHL